MQRTKLQPKTNCGQLALVQDVDQSGISAEHRLSLAGPPSSNIGKSWNVRTATILFSREEPRVGCGKCLMRLFNILLDQNVQNAMFEGLVDG